MKAKMPNRITRLRTIMREKGIESLLVTGRENVRYLTGFTGSAGTVLIGLHRAILITDFRYMLQARREAPGIATVIQKADWESAIHETAQRAGVGLVWFDESSVSIATFKRLKKKGLRLQGERDLISDLRQRKDVREIARIKKAVRRAEEAFRGLKRYIKPGVTEQELGLKLEYLIRESGSRKTAFDTIVASGRNGAMPHAAVSSRRIGKNDLVTFDFGAEADGYYSDLTRTVCVGEPTARQRAIHGLVLKAQRAAIAAIRPGVHAKTIDQAARKIITDAGHGKDFGHSLGHGIGLLVHEGPAISTRSETILEEGMVFTVEPGVYIPGWGGVRIEDIAVVSRGGAQEISTLPREL